MKRFMCKEIWVKCHPFFSMLVNGQITLQLWDLAFPSVKWGLPDLQGFFKLYEWPCYFPIGGFKHQLYAITNLPDIFCINAFCSIQSQFIWGVHSTWRVEEQRCIFTSFDLSDIIKKTEVLNQNNYQYIDKFLVM